MGSIPGSGRVPEEGNSYPRWYSCLENPVDRGAWRVTVPGVTKSWRQLKPPPPGSSGVGAAVLSQAPITAGQRAVPGADSAGGPDHVKP